MLMSLSTLMNMQKIKVKAYKYLEHKLTVFGW